MNFEQAVLTEFPEVTDTITRQQALFVKEKYNLKFPHHIVNPNNNVGRGIFKFSAALPLESVQPQKPEETDAELDKRITETYANLKLMTNSVSDGTVTSMIISGSAGVGKSYLIKRELDKNPTSTYTYIRGYVRATGIFKLLWENRFSHQIIVFDDADSVFEDVVGLNLLKAALELSKSRKICWMSEKEFVDEDGNQIPSYFDYDGQIIFLTNIDFHELINKGSKLSPHLAALESRSLYFDLKVKTNREKMTRIRQVVEESKILEDRGIYADEEKELMQFLVDNVDRLREVSLRTVEKLAALYLTSPSKWKSLASCMMFK